MAAVKLDELRRRAMALSQRALSAYPTIPDALKAQLTLGTYFEENGTLFELYLPGDRPEDAIVSVSVLIDNDTADGHVTVNDDNWRRLGLLPH